MLSVNQFGLVFHHLGLAVRKPDSAFRYLAALGYQDGAVAFDPLQNVQAAMRHHAEMPDVEVIWPGEGPSPVDNVLKHHHGIVYHMCYSAADPERSIVAMQQADLHVLPVSPAKPAVLFGGREVSFYMIADFGLIEFLKDPA